jgi:hypothetical protein
MCVPAVGTETDSHPFCHTRIDILDCGGLVLGQAAFTDHGDVGRTPADRGTNLLLSILALRRVCPEPIVAIYHPMGQPISCY